MAEIFPAIFLFSRMRSTLIAVLFKSVIETTATCAEVGEACQAKTTYDLDVRSK